MREDIIPIEVKASQTKKYMGDEMKNTGILLLINISALFYYALVFIPLLEKEIEKSLGRLTNIQKMESKEIILNKKVKKEAREANNHLIEVYTNSRKLMWIGLLSLVAPIAILLLGISRVVLPQISPSIWALLLVVGLGISLWIVCRGMRQRPTKKYYKLILHAKECNEEEFLEMLDNLERFN